MRPEFNYILEMGSQTKSDCDIERILYSMAHRTLLGKFGL
jgi:hypothetical protein